MWIYGYVSQRIARTDKKAFLSQQCKEIEENKNGKTRNLFKKIGDTKGNISCKDELNKDRKGQDLTEAEMLRRDDKNTNTQKNYTKEFFVTQITTMV